jgi:hypothetical protein
MWFTRAQRSLDAVSGARRPHEHLELVAIDGHPSGEELRAVQSAVEHVIEAELRASAPSMWLRANRARGRRLGMYDYRGRFNQGEAWRLSLRFPPGGREHPGRTGRGDAK